MSISRSFADGGGGPQSALRQGRLVPPRVHHRSLGVRAVSPPPPASRAARGAFKSWTVGTKRRTWHIGPSGDRHGLHGDKKHRTWRTPQQQSNNPHGDRATQKAYPDGPHRYLEGAHMARCKIPLGEASHDAGTADVAVAFHQCERRTR